MHNNNIIIIIPLGVACHVNFWTPLSQPLGTRSNCCRSRMLRGHIPMYNLLPVYIPCFLQALYLVHFISTIPNKDQQKEHLFSCPVVFDFMSSVAAV